MAWWKVWESNRSDGEPKTVNIFLGYFFLVNYCIGTGFLGVPYSFFYSGYLAAIPTLIITAFSAWVTARWLIEIMSRAQVLPLIICYIYYINFCDSLNNEFSPSQHPAGHLASHYGQTLSCSPHPLTYLCLPPPQRFRLPLTLSPHSCWHFGSITPPPP